MAEREYKDSEGNVVTLDKLVRIEPEWAANIIRWYDGKLDRYRTAMKAVVDACDLPDADYTAVERAALRKAREALSDEYHVLAAVRELIDERDALSRKLAEESETISNLVAENTTLSSKLESYRAVLDALRSEMEEVRRENEALQYRLEQCQRVVGFFASVIQSGEPWTDHCQAAFDGVIRPSRDVETPVHPRDTRCPGKVDGEHQWERWENESTGETGMECAVCHDGYPTLSA